MPYITVVPCEPKARPGDGEHEHPLEQPGVEFIALEVKDRGEKGVWLLSDQPSGNPDYTEKWYKMSWVKSISWPEYHGVEPVPVDPIPDEGGPEIDDEIVLGLDVLDAVRLLGRVFRGEE